MSSAPASSTYAATDGAAYDRFIGRWSRRLADAVAPLAEPLPDGALLDVGCGTGSMALALAERYPEREVVGIDVAEPYLRYAARRPGGSAIRFVREDACGMSFPDASFAAAYGLLLLNFVPEPLRAVREMRRVTCPGGAVFAAGWDFRGGLVYQRILWDSAAGVDAGAAGIRDRLFSGKMASPSGMVDLFREAGLDDVRRDSVTIRMDFADFADYWDPLLGGQGPVGAYVAGLPPDKQVAVREAVRAAFLSGSPDGERSLTATAWVVRGTVP
ncbi:MAG TPA: class I SAM-dependent methyltransferase [Afifellaceae bacterium]|nr:class I SAM-dependent methyltransferase [Afifellaceae bacterium]